MHKLHAERQQELSATEHHMKLSEESDARSVAELEARAAQAELREKKEHLEVVSQEAERLATALSDENTKRSAYEIKVKALTAAMTEAEKAARDREQRMATDRCRRPFPPGSRYIVPVETRCCRRLVYAGPTTSRSSLPSDRS